jgi:hypothetical protein
MKRLAALALAIAAPVAFAYDLNGVPIGGDEQAVKKAFPSAYCKPLEWSSTVADRRCDDAKIAVGGVPARVTVYLKTGAIQAVSVRFDVNDRDRVIAHLKSRWGPPAGEKTETIARKGKDDRKVYKVNWEKGNERALLTAQSDRRRGSLEVWRGNFIDEIYKVR